MIQSDFTAALLDPARPVPSGLTDPAGRPAGKRFSVYRNNVAVSLTEALRQAFPVTRRILGDEFFDAMAGIYLRAHPPTSPLMMFYGAEMPDFLGQFPPVAHLGYLPDIARLELALRRSYHAADAAPMVPEALAAMPRDRLMQARVTLAPAVRLIRSSWPVHAIWRANTADDAPAPMMRPEDVLITRPGFDPVPDLLPDGGGAVVAALMAGRSLGEALAETSSGLDRLFALLIGGGAITGVSEERP